MNAHKEIESAYMLVSVDDLMMNFYGNNIRLIKKLRKIFDDI